MAIEILPTSQPASQHPGKGSESFQHDDDDDDVGDGYDDEQQQDGTMLALSSDSFLLQMNGRKVTEPSLLKKNSV